MEAEAKRSKKTREHQTKCSLSLSGVVNGPYGLFPPTYSDSDSDSKPYCYIVLCRTFSLVQIQIPV